ncbi:hypothetical protein [Tabrizicola sp.]|uniref:hypothetical protein n=1 Tax=Tabrizicola sp. TaxID=2005166 RepID=UPI00286CF889|nr:hypothetical protein [Tabrizicola sp.]
MIIRRLRLTLPPGMKATAALDARLLGEALAHALSRCGDPPARISLSLPGAGHTAPVLAQRLTTLLPKGGLHGH